MILLVGTNQPAVSAYDCLSHLEWNKLVGLTLAGANTLILLIKLQSPLYFHPPVSIHIVQEKKMKWICRDYQNYGFTK